MKRTPEPRPLTELELEVMKAVWEVSGGTIRQVHEALSARRRIAYTTVQTMLNILVTKGHLRRDPGEGRAHVYSPLHTQSRVISSLVEEFVGRVFRGSARPLVLSLVKDRRITREELDEILKAAAASSGEPTHRPPRGAGGGAPPPNGSEEST